MTRKIYLLVFFLQLVLVYSQNIERPYPAWFLYPSKNVNLYVGYSYNKYSALEDVASMTSLFNECIVSGTLNMYSMEDSREMYKDSDYYYYFDADNKVVNEDELIPVDIFYVSMLQKSYIELFASDSNYQIAETQHDASVIPSWTNKTFFDDGIYYYGVGMYTSIGNKIDAWKTSEEKGIFNIMLNNAVSVKKVKYTADFYDDTIVYDEIIEYQFRYHLKEIEIIERFPDYKNELFYTLVRIKKDNVRAAF